MNKEDFHHQSSGTLLNNLEGRLTFVPDPLYPAFQLTGKIQTLISEVTVLLGRLDGMALTLP
ncbi:MAG: hypothetical protein H7144_11260, partial [Burkholderiales bacterium]|nr:hypothetical protein [Phycisphaerae bacterium]